MNRTAANKLPSFATSNKKCVVKQITINLTSDEAKKLEEYCKQTGKTATAVIRELIHTLHIT